MNIKDKINNLNLEELKQLLTQVSNYNDLKTKLWKRWTALFQRNLNNKDLLVVEYFWDNSKENIFELSAKVFKDVYKVEANISEINFIRNDKIKWWMKVYKNDEMVDLSFSKIEKQIK